MAPLGVMAVLQGQPVGIHDSFFELGGDSIRAIQVLARARQAGLPILLEQLFQNRTIHELCRQCLSSSEQIRTDARQIQTFSMLSEQDRKRLPKDLEDAYPASRLQIGMLYHSDLHPDTAVYHDIFSYRIEAPLDQEKLWAAIRQLTVRHPGPSPLPAGLMGNDSGRRRVLVGVPGSGGTVPA